MKNSIYLFLFYFFLTLSLFAQPCDYSIPKYGVRTTKNIKVGTDLDFRLNPVDLFMDIYYPVGSPEHKRPLIMLAFGGGFFQGKRTDLDALCKTFTERGFVAATIDYRIGFHGQPPISYDKAEIKRAGFRGMQDGKAMLRFLKERHLTDSIDLERIWLSGVSAGAFIALGTAFVDKPSDKPIEADSIASTNTVLRPDLGFFDGNLVRNNFDTKVQGVFNIFGGLLDTLQIEKNDNIALISYHQNGDPVVPCDGKTPYWPYPFIPENYPVVFGSCAIHERLKNIGYPDRIFETWIFQGANHDIHDQPAVLRYFFNNANPLLCSTIISVKDYKAENYIHSINHKSIILNNHSLGNSFYFLDMQGRTIRKGKVQSTEISFSDIQPGIYILKVGNQASKILLD